MTIRSRRYLVASGWGAAQLIGPTGLSPEDVLATSMPVSAVGSNAAGQAFVAWGLDPY